jgi:hypothetical protein
MTASMIFWFLIAAAVVAGLHAMTSNSPSTVDLHGPIARGEVQYGSGELVQFPGGNFNTARLTRELRCALRPQLPGC